ncbi:MAG: RNase adapter RapZ [Betaproteobacteria bacterium]|nr:RNase adapter RapZ [Betaproteobacteria bacterium]
MSTSSNPATQLVLVSGLSGSGKSIALRVLEDAGYYCIDNLPAALLEDTLRVLAEYGEFRVAISIDARSKDSYQQLPEWVSRLQTGLDLRLLFLEAKTETLVRRFSETRRRHPLSSDQRALHESIELERDLLDPVARLAHRIDTSDLSVSTLQTWIKDFVAVKSARLTLLFISFGFKHGIPLDADLVFDVRCLPNPHYDPELRPLNGRDQPVKAFLQNSTDVSEMLQDIRQYVEKWLPCFIRDHRAYLTVAIGCTGGQHRSVYLCEQLAQHFSTREQCLVRHRELK